MEYVNLRDICEIKMGQSPESSSYNSDKQGVPFYQGNADFGALYPSPRIWCNKPIKLAKENDILISVRAPVGALNFSKEECCIGRGLAAITLDSNDFLLEFIYWSLRTGVKELQSKSTGSTFKSINKKTLEEVRIPKISLKEQKDIIRNLTLLTNILAKYKHEIVFMDELVKARFVEMFGDPVSNSKDLPIQKMNNVAPICQYDGSFEERVWLLNLDMVESQTGRIINYNIVGKDAIGGSVCTFDENNILYSKLRPYLNKVVIPNGKGYATSELVPLRPDNKIINRIYLAYLLRSNEFVEMIKEKVAGAKMPRVSMSDFREFNVPVPPLEFQNQFASFVQEIDKSRLLELLAIEHIELLLND
ncbi:restriction endonuclease subunit S [uncultured Catenibacterium sp.]|uniref:restriction endonuclease subunit S n=1 Tax=uncultured Catenibacterium sp. TaxID=286142 RepID=UPI002600B925|nr:restriction endonuclease subunit S [uncultured Catenibacterium sp.]